MGQILSGGSSRPATAEELQSIGTMRQELSQLPVPTLQHRDNPHEYLFFALFDGSGQDLNNPKLGPPTNVGELAMQLQKLENDPRNRIGAHYAKGIGAQNNGLVRLADGLAAFTWDNGIEKIYREFAAQVRDWKREDPQAEVRVAGVGYSRGAVQTAGFHRLVDQYGVMHPDDLKFGRDPHGNITIESARPPLVPPGQVAQAAALFDAVGASFPKNYDSRLSPSVISSASILAANERRQTFPHHAINDPGMTPDGRAITVTAPGGHSNIGGGNKEPGLEILVGNAMIDYLNRLRDVPMFEKRAVPTDPATMTIYQAQGATAVFGLKMDGDGRRDLREALANCKVVDPCRDAEPMNRELAGQFERRRGVVDPAEQMQLQALVDQARAQAAARIGQHPADAARQPFKPLGDPAIDRFFDAHHAGDREGMRAALIVFKDSDRGQAVMAEAHAQARTERERQLPRGHDHPLYAQALQHVERLGPRAGGFNTQEELERVAGALALQAKRERMPSIDAVLPSLDGKGLFASQANAANDVLASRAYVDKTQAVTQPVDQNLQQLVAETQLQEQQVQIQAQQRQAAQSQGMSR